MAHQSDTNKPSLEVRPLTVRAGNLVVLLGRGWPDCALTIEIDGTPVRVHDILRGSPIGSDVRPDGYGNFSVQFATRDLDPGTHEIITSARRHDIRVATKIEIMERPRFRADGSATEGSYWRVRHFFESRFGHLGFVPPGIRDVQMAGIRRLRNAQRRTTEPIPRPGGPPPTPPMPGGCNWTPTGPGPVAHAQTEGSPDQAVSGRLLAIAIDPTPPNTVFVGTAAGGIWKSTDGGATWSPKTDHEISPAIGALAIDPTNHERILAGTGEYHHNTAGGLSYYGKGVLRSTDEGETWDEHAGVTFDRHEISRIVFDPTDATGEKVYLSASNGVFESLDNGQTWSLLFGDSASDLVAFEPTGPPNRLTLIAAIYGSGLWTSTRDAGVWDPWTQIIDPAFPATVGRIALGQCAETPRTIYALFAWVGFVRLVKTTTGGNSWSVVTVRLNTDVLSITNGGGPDNHVHTFTVPAAHLTANPADHTYTTTSAGSSPHTHTVDLTSEQIEQLATGMIVFGTTNPDATNHEHPFGMGTTRQGDYNLHVSIKPDDADVIYLGEVFLWRNKSGGGEFENITDGFGFGPPGVPIGIHVDQHAFAFDPGNPDIVWAGNDGGVYRSLNGGNTWEHRNRDLQTLQYLAIAVHPTREAVMLGGTQDNGTHRYAGHPAWMFSDGGDGGFAQIDPQTPTRMYHGVTNNDVRRSDEAGAKGTWNIKTGVISGTAEGYPPFELDPIDSNVCYFGNSRLWRSGNNADDWDPITDLLDSNITAIAIHPTDPTKVYVGTVLGHVYLFDGGANWDETELTAAPLPSGVYISDLAVDTNGNVWVTFSAVTLSDIDGDFTNDHVFRRDAITGIWEPRVTGLVQANPVNSIVIDPTNQDRLFVGADVGVFRTENGIDWTLWDEGLPNTPVFDLRIGPLRLLRAATHGRGVWERPIDLDVCPLVDLYVRDNILDTGRVVPSYDGVSHPFDPALNVHHWQSPDIKVDAPDPTYQTSTPVTDYVFFEGDLQHEIARRMVQNRFYAQVHNRGPFPATNVQVRAFFASAAMGLPPLPANFWSAGKPFVGDPAGPDWTPVGPTKTISVLEPAEPGLVSWEWPIPGSATKHSCLLVVATCDEDPIDGAGIFNTDTLVLTRKHVALKNLHVENAVMGAMSAADPIIVEMHDGARHGGFYGLQLWWGSLPDDARVFVVFEISPEFKSPITVSDRELQSLGIIPAPNATELFHDRYEIGCDGPRTFDLSRCYELLRPKDRSVTFPRLFVPGTRPLTVAINVVLPERMEADAQFDLVQRSGLDHIVGGSTYLLRAPGSVQAV